VRDLQRLAPAVLAGVLPRLYPEMLEIAYGHQDAGRPIFICTAASQEMAELMAIVLTFDGAVGSVSEVVDGQYTGRAGGAFTYREGKAQAIRELAAARDRPFGLLGLLGLRVRSAHAPRGRPSRRGQPRRHAAAGRSRGGLGGAALRAARPAGQVRGGAAIARGRRWGGALSRAAIPLGARRGRAA
jgi:hypothetical protein